jgi:hypothetical protein
LKLKKLFAIEISVAAVILVIILLVVEVTPYLDSSKPESQIGLYNQRVFAEGKATVSAGQPVSAWFNYSSFDPPIMVFDLTFQSWQTSGALSIYCNGLRIATIDASPDNPHVVVTAIAVSGLDLVKTRADLVFPGTANAYFYGNQIAFTPDPGNGYEGSFGYQISLRGSR